MGSNTTTTVDAYDFPVSSVLVFRNQAEVTRLFPVQLKTGNNEIEIVHLPTSMLSDSLRVQGVGKGVTVLDHATRSQPTNLFGRPFGQLAKHETKKLKELKATQKAAKSQLELLNAQATIFRDYSESMKAEHIDPAQFVDFMTVFHKTGFANVEAVKQKEKEIEEIEAQIQKEKEVPANSEEQENERKSAVTVVVKAETDANAELKLIYVVTAASWQPNYEIRATTDSNGQLTDAVTLHYRAAITQSSGEDWKNSSITLSTTQPAFSHSVLPHTGLKVGPASGAGVGNLFKSTGSIFGQPQQQMQQQMQQAPPPQQNHHQLSQQQQQQQTYVAQMTGQQSQVVIQPQPILVTSSAPQNSYSAFSTNASANPNSSQGGFSFANPSSGATGGLFGTSNGVSLFESATPCYPPQSPRYSPNSPSLALAALSEGAALEPFSYASAVAETNALTATYKIEGKTTIPSDRASHKVAISMSTMLPIHVYVVTVPRAQPWAYLQGTIKNTTNELLLAGPATVFNDESYVGTASVPLTSAQESFTCSLGADNKVRVSFVHSKDKPITSNFAFAGNTESVLCKNVIKVKNTHNVAIPKIIVRDSVPVGADPIKVILKNPEALATAADKDAEVKVGDGGKVVARWSKQKQTSREEGLVEFVMKDTASGEEKQVELTWVVEGPPGVKWSYSSA